MSTTSTSVPPLILSRSFPQPREALFKAFSTAELVKRWFSPEGLTTPYATVEFHSGGLFEVCMAMPDGTQHWSRGRFLEVSPPHRLVFITGVDEGEGPPLFSAHTTVTFEPEGSGARLSVVQAYDVHDPALMSAIEGAPEGWRTTLNKLERLAAELHSVRKPEAKHDSFTLNRGFSAAPAKVFQALTEVETKARWFVGPEGYETLAREMDVRPGGRERLQGRLTSGLVSTFDAYYFDVVENARLVFAYEMHLNDQKISVSLATWQLLPEGQGTRLVLTEQGVFLDGYNDAGARARGTAMLLDQLAAALGD
jgi:uncharacterized protein YndB with AHSA1/START domain